jgi:hypothetical protein
VEFRITQTQSAALAKSRPPLFGTTAPRRFVQSLVTNQEACPYALDAKKFPTQRECIVLSRWCPSVITHNASCANGEIEVDEGKVGGR